MVPPSASATAGTPDDPTGARTSPPPWPPSPPRRRAPTPRPDPTDHPGRTRRGAAGLRPGIPARRDLLGPALALGPLGVLLGEPLGSVRLAPAAGRPRRRARCRRETGASPAGAPRPWSGTAPSSSARRYRCRTASSTTTAGIVYQHGRTK